MIVAIDTGGTKTLITLFSHDGVAGKKIKFPTPKDEKEYVNYLKETLKTNYGGQRIEAVVYLLQKRSQDSPKSGPVAVNTASPAPSKAPPESSKPSVTPEASKKPSSSPVKPAPTKTPAPKPSPQATSNIPTTANLPTTGPAEDFAGTFMLAVLIGVVAAYLRSYRVRYGYQTE